MLPRFAQSAYRFSPLTILIFTVQRLRRNKEADVSSASLLRSAHCTVKTDCTILSKLLQGFPPCTPRRSRKLIFLFCMSFCRQIFFDGNFSKKMPSLFYACYSMFFKDRGKNEKCKKIMKKRDFIAEKKNFIF